MIDDALRILNRGMFWVPTRNSRLMMWNFFRNACDESEWLKSISRSLLQFIAINNCYKIVMYFDFSEISSIHLKITVTYKKTCRIVNAIQTLKWYWNSLLCSSMTQPGFYDVYEPVRRFNTIWRREYDMNYIIWSICYGHII